LRDPRHPEKKAAGISRGPFFNMSDDDLHALILYGGAVYLDATMTPSYRQLETTSAYQRGAELFRMRRGPIRLAHLDEQLQRSSPASLAFESVNDREPREGGLLSYDDVVRDSGANTPIFSAFINAWNRRLPGLACPLKLENGELYFRTLDDGSGEVWQQKTDVSPQGRWKTVQSDATGKESAAFEDVPPVLAVIFLGVVNGQHRCKSESEPVPTATVR
jgi:hypothetical protein